MPLGYKRNYAYNLKKKYSKGILTEDTMSKILKRAITLMPNK